MKINWHCFVLESRSTTDLPEFTEGPTFLFQDSTDITIQDKDGNTALMHASRLGYVPVIQAFVNHFLKRELDASLLRQRNNQGKNALEIAKEEEKIECVRLLTNFLTQYNTAYAQDQVRRAQLSTGITKAKSLDSITMERDAEVMLESIISSKHRKESGKYRDSHSDGFESALRRKIECLKSSGLANNERPGYFEEIWQQETMSWFSDDSNCRSLQNNRKPEEAVRFPPIKGNKLIDYKTWCDMGNQNNRRFNHETWVYAKLVIENFIAKVY